MKLGTLAACVVVALLVCSAVYCASPARGAETFASGERTIFVSVASYRDADCVETLKSMFANASKPARIHAGVCEQNTKDASEACMPAGFKWHDQVRRISLPHGEAKGPTYARYLCSTLYRGETYFCQIDSHTRFVAGWDEKAIRMLEACPSAKPVLTHYPHDVDQKDSGTTHVPVLCKAKFDAHGVPTLEAVTLKASKEPKPVPFTSGGFIFGPGSMLKEVPYDPDLPQLFQGEEILYSARLWTSGYDFYTPTQNLVFHKYYRTDAPKFWSDIEYELQQKQTLHKVKKLLGGDMKEYPHGMGAARSLEEYYKFAGIDWEAKKCTSSTRFCA